MGLSPDSIVVRVAVDAIDVVARMKRMAFPCSPMLDAPTVEQHDRYIETPFASRGHTRSQPVKISRIELRHIEFRLAIERLARPCARPR